MRGSTVNLMRPEPGETFADKVRRAVFWIVILAALAIVWGAGTTMLGRNS